MMSNIRPGSSLQEEKEICIPLQQLDPEPVGFCDNDHKNSLTNSSLLPSWFHPIGLSSGDRAATRGGRGSIYYLTQLQRYSSYAFTIFAGFHITNTSLLPLLTRSVPASESYLLLTRPYYQSFPLESLLVGLPIIVHVTAGIALRLHKRNINLVRYGAIYLPISTRFEKRLKVWPPISWTSIAGYLMIPLVGSHILINRVLPWLYEGGSSSVGLGYVAHIFAKHPYLAFFNYSAMIGLVSGHFSWGFCRWNKLIIDGNSEKARRRRWSINIVSVVLALAWMSGGFGIVARGGQATGWVGNGYDDLIEHLWL
ncbi:hypothetical protein OnM2_017067 [Erysiphe neolycopersici]|uniref:Mitochondrial adapter protein MCP1 transmembrane domain-containing protein n=1 Tax=Erysiphe neolycopersici TaxID=212602 RepID=A0A420I4U7_9PEZI|nr:hypothetical protein OnM2_017067 [Erysiphe neolycopersici]